MPFESHICWISPLREDRSCFAGLFVDTIVDVEIQTDAKIGGATQKWRVNPKAAIVIVQGKTDEDSHPLEPGARGRVGQ
jgi:hypothetical protein